MITDAMTTEGTRGVITIEEIMTVVMTVVADMNPEEIMMTGAGMTDDTRRLGRLKNAFGDSISRIQSDLTAWLTI